MLVVSLKLSRIQVHITFTSFQHPELQSFRYLKRPEKTLNLYRELFYIFMTIARTLYNFNVSKKVKVNGKKFDSMIHDYVLISQKTTII